MSEITHLLDAAVTAGTAPKLLVLDNVVGFVRAFEGRDFAAVMTALVSAGYEVGAVMMDVWNFLPQSRERMITNRLADKSAARAERSHVSIPSSEWHACL